MEPLAVGGVANDGGYLCTSLNVWSEWNNYEGNDWIESCSADIYSILRLK